MQIQHYFPEPLAVPGRVSQESHRVIVTFIKRASVLHFMIVALSSALTWRMPMLIQPGMAWIVFLGSLLALTIVRRVHDGGWLDNLWSTILLAPTVFATSQIGHQMVESQWPLWAIPLGAFCAAIYVAVCGRDFSFPGQGVLCILATWIIITTMAVLGWITMGAALKAALTSFIYLFYYSYDMAMILHRRRLNELPAAAADFFRDLINFLTYALRILLHWRKFRFQP